MFDNKNLWEIKKDTTKLFHHDNAIKEYLNTDNLDLIIKSKYNKTYTDRKWLEEFHCPFTDIQSHLKKVRAQIRNGFLVTKAQVSGYGRASFKGNISMALLPCEVRQALSIGTTYDYDIADAQPQFLLNICRIMKVPEKEYANLKYYCENRKKFMRKVFKKYFPNNKSNDKGIKSIIKVLVISRCFFGGSLKTWRQEFNIPDKIHDSDLIVGLKKEVESICGKYVLQHNCDIFGEELAKHNNEYQEKMKLHEKDKNKHAKPVKRNTKMSLMSKFLQNWERIIIETLLLELIESGRMVKDRFIYVYDGFQHSEQIPCEELEKIVFQKTGFKLKFEIKNTEDGVALMQEVQEKLTIDMKAKEHPEKYLQKFNIEYFETLKYDFDLAKDYWERFVCFTVKDGNYWFQNCETFKDPETGRVRTKRETIPYKWSALNESFGDVMTQETIMTPQGPKTIVQPFIKRWKAEGMRKFYKMDFYPENKPFEERLKADYFNTFTGYPDFVYEDIDKKNYKKFKSIWEGILINLLGNKKAMYHFNNIISYKIKYPARKKPFGIIIKGRQGEGKNFVLSRIAKVISENHYLTTSNIKDVIGDYAMGLFHKLIVNLNEMDLTSTKSITNKFKSVVSENTITFNPKHSNQFESINYALMVITSNETIPIVLDVMTGERRWFIFEGNGKNCKISQEKWTQIFKMTESDEFIKFLYDYYNDMECEKFDFKKAKIENSKEEAYNNVASLFIPYEMLFLKDWIISGEYMQYQDSFVAPPEPTNPLDLGVESENDDDDDDEWIKPYWEFKEFYRNVTIEIKQLLSDFWDWSKRMRIPLGEQKKEKSFVGKIMSFNFKHMEKGTHSKTRRRTISFTPEDLLRQLIDKRAFYDDVDKWEKLQKDGNYKQEDDKEDLEFLDLL